MLTDIQFKIYMMIVMQAMDGRTIAEELHCSRSFVSRHTRKIFDIMGVGNRLELLTQYWHRELHPQEQP